MAQGLCAGGEFNGAIVFALEHVGKDRPGFTGGLIIGSCLLGSILAIGASAVVLNLPSEKEWWRLAFIIGVLLRVFFV